MRKHLQELLEREPFSRFRIVLTSGKEYEVPYAHLVALGESEITLYKPKLDQWIMLRLNQVTSLESAQPA